MVGPPRCTSSPIRTGRVAIAQLTPEKHSPERRRYSDWNGRRPALGTVGYHKIPHLPEQIRQFFIGYFRHD
jgi:hypothetical protein